MNLDFFRDEVLAATWQAWLDDIPLTWISACTSEMP